MSEKTPHRLTHPQECSQIHSILEKNKQKQELHITNKRKKTHNCKNPSKLPIRLPTRPNPNKLEETHESLISQRFKLYEPAFHRTKERLRYKCSKNLREACKILPLSAFLLRAPVISLKRPHHYHPHIKYRKQVICTSQLSKPRWLSSARPLLQYASFLKEANQESNRISTSFTQKNTRLFHRSNMVRPNWTIFISYY